MRWSTGWPVAGWCLPAGRRTDGAPPRTSLAQVFWCCSRSRLPGSNRFWSPLSLAAFSALTRGTLGRSAGHGALANARFSWSTICQPGMLSGSGAVPAWTRLLRMRWYAASAPSPADTALGLLSPFLPAAGSGRSHDVEVPAVDGQRVGPFVGKTPQRRDGALRHAGGAFADRAVLKTQHAAAAAFFLIIDSIANASYSAMACCASVQITVPAGLTASACLSAAVQPLTRPWPWITRTVQRWL